MAMQEQLGMSLVLRETYSLGICHAPPLLRQIGNGQISRLWKPLYELPIGDFASSFS